VVLAGGGFVPSALGRRRASTCRHNDRHVRCSLERGRLFGFPARVTPVQRRKVSAPRLGRPYRTERSGPPQKRGLTLSLGDQLSPWREPQWNAGRRARPAGRAPHLASAAVTTRLSAFCFLFLLPFVRAPCPIVMNSALHCRVDPTKVGMRRGFWEWLAHSSGANKNRAARTRALVRVAAVP
jgi:hypothetical protein